MGAVFSIEAMFIAIREGMEIGLVIGILVGVCERRGLKERKRDIWIGVLAAVLVSVVIGVALGIVKYAKGKDLFTGNNAAIFEAVTFLVAAVLVTYMIAWSLKSAKTFASELAKDMDDALEKNSRWSLMFFCFLQVVKEGIELVLLVIGSLGGDDPKRIPIPAIVGLGIAFGFCYLFFRGSIRMDLRKFFLWSNTILCMFAAGLTSRAFNSIARTGAFGEYANLARRPWYLQPLWTTAAAAPQETNGFFTVLRFLFGYASSPSLVEFITYFGYYVIIVSIAAWINYDAWFRQTKTADARRNVGILSLYILLMTIVGVVFATGGPYGNGRSWNGILVCSLYMAFCVAGLAVVIFDVRRLVTLMFGVSAVLLCLSLALNIADLAEGPKDAPGGIQRFFYYMLVWDWKWANSYKVGTYATPVALLLIALFMNIIICGGFTAQLWKWRLAIARGDEDRGAAHEQQHLVDTELEDYVKGGNKDVEAGIGGFGASQYVSPSYGVDVSSAA